MIKFLLSVFLFCISCNSIAESYDSISDELVFVGGTIRQSESDSSKWCWVSDAGHKVIGFDSSVCGVASGSSIVLKYGRKFKRVGSIVIGPDETLARDFGLSVGASVSYEFMIIKGSDNDGEVDFAQYMANGNIWISGIMVR